VKVEDSPFADRGRHNLIELTEEVVMKQKQCPKCKTHFIGMSFIQILTHYHTCVSKYCQVCPICGLALRGKKFLKEHLQNQHSY
jgi:hypothetical protein